MRELPAASRHASGQTAEFRRRFLLTVMAASLLWGGLISIPSAIGWLPLGSIQSVNNLVLFASNCALFFALQRRSDLFTPIAILFLFTTFIYISAAQFLVLHDQLRMLLYFPMVGAVFLILGATAGWMTLIASLAVFGFTVATDVVDVTPLATSTFVLTLCVTGIFFHVFRAQAIDALDTIAQQNRILDAAARRDPLTGLFNRRAFQDALDAHLSADGASTPFSVAFVDVDRFKEINDRHGHAVGDEVLVAVARMLQSALRSQDVLARIGGEEFAVLLPSTDLSSSLSVAERLRSTIGAMRTDAADGAASVTVSIGLAGSQSAFGSVEAMLEAADAAMYTAKREGRDRVVAWGI